VFSANPVNCAGVACGYSTLTASFVSCQARGMTSFALTTFISVVGMHPFRSADSLWYRAALYLAFVAIYLLFAGPLLSQLQASHASGHAHHDEHALCLSHSDPTPSSSHALEHWHHQCDYCGVWQQSPSAPNHLPAIGSWAFIDASPLPNTFYQRTVVWLDYPHACPRAPPLLQAS